ncbi:hypothetical protein GF339_14795 [candidate division KSB3 bacterium]|uniref:Polyamine aminopropyltransferase n=1 Tax=candidate division KSB3 bacterium TaxID=2044937 RepID=A0A9D5JXM9_9BACT|nr:hypothetical protein [candidate division KSB3 bacterium]MBD3325851.1 hypothetical protein [candidate division KSB3 bacterium]
MYLRLLLLSYACLGGYALLVQVVCIREILVVFHGNELCLGIIFACWLGGIALGAGTASRLADRLHHRLPLYLSLLLLLCVLFPVQIASIRLLRHVLDVSPGAFIPPLKLLGGLLLTISPLSGCIGMTFPLACTLVPQSATQHIGRVYIAEAIGSMLSGILFTFVLVTRYHAFQIAAGAGMSLGVITALLSLYALRKDAPAFSRDTSSFTRLVGVIAIIGIGVYSYAVFSTTATALQQTTTEQRWQSMHPHIDRVNALDSKYQHLSLGTQAGQYVLFTNGQYASVFPDPYESATTAQFLLTQHPNPESVLLIGGGVEGLIAAMLQHPLQNLDYVELDPKLLDLLADYLPPETQDALNDPRFSLIYADGRYYVKHTHHRYDMVILNIPDPTNAMLNRFYTLEFFREIQAILNPGGVVITQIGASLHLQDRAANYTGSLYKTLTAVFPYVLVAPGTTNTYFAASEPNVITFEHDTLRRRYREHQIDSPYFSAYHYDMLLQPEQIAFATSTLRQGLDEFRLNTDLQPVTYFYSLLLWLQFSETSPERVSPPLTLRLFQALKDLPFWWFGVAMAGLVLLRLGYRYRSSPSSPGESTRFNCLWAITTTGFTGIALELILIFAFQNMYGYIYQKAGLIVAMFMVGLTVGGYISHRLISRGNSISFQPLQTRLLANEIALALFAALLPLGIRLLSRAHFSSSLEYLFMLLVGITGVLTGLEFPLASALYWQSHRNVGMTAGMLDSADHLGACCGSMLVGIVFIPLLGIPAACYVVSLLNGSSVVFLLVEKFVPKA